MEYFINSSIARITVIEDPLQSNCNICFITRYILVQSRPIFFWPRSGLCFLAVGYQFWTDFLAQRVIFEVRATQHPARVGSLKTRGPNFESGLGPIQPYILQHNKLTCTMLGVVYKICITFQPFIFRRQVVNVRPQHSHYF